MRGLAKRATGLSFGIAVIAAVAAPAAGGSVWSLRKHVDPIAHVACASTGCTEQSTLTVPAGGQGETEMDVLPPKATQGSIGLQPACAGPASDPGMHASCDDADLAAFDGLVTVVALTNRNRFNFTHLSVKSVRILSCFILASVLSTKNGTVDTTADGPTPPLLLLGTCLQLAQALNAEEGARDASARCHSIIKSIKVVALTRAHGAYTAHLKGMTSTPKKTAVAISCRRQGVGVKLTLRPRGRARTLKQAITGPLGIAYANPGKTAVAVRTTFKVN